MNLTVKKFGGSSLGTPERIGRVADLIAQSVRDGERVVAVVSAMGDTTDELLELAHSVSPNPGSRELDMLLSSGERISMALVGMALEARGVKAQSLTGSQVGILTDSRHQQARIRTVLGDRVRESLDAGAVVVVAGYQGVCAETKEITTLGRGGSDTSAVALAVGLGANRCQIFSDVPGVYSTDPKTPGVQPKLWRELPYENTLVLASQGAQVLHVRSVEIARKYGLTLELKSSLEPQKPGTNIMKREEIKNLEGLKFTGVTCDRNRCLLELQLARPSVALGLWEQAEALGLSYSGLVSHDASASAWVDRTRVGDWDKQLRQWTQEGFVRQFELKTRLVPVAAVGECFSQGAYARALTALREENIEPEIARVDSLSIVLGVPEHRADDAVRALHKNFLEGNA